jgi:hypothetical protein
MYSQTDPPARWRSASHHACSYYYDGLSQAEFVDALVVLLRMGKSPQQSFYNEWLDLSRPYLQPGSDMQACY